MSYLNQFQAASHGNLDWFLNNDVDLKLTDPYFGSTALMFASRYGHVDVVSYLISKKASVYATSRRDKTALILASRHGHAAVVSLLLKVSFDDKVPSYVDAVDWVGYTALIKACQCGHAETVSILMSAGASPYITQDDGFSALTLANSASVSAMLDAGAEFKPSGADALTPIGQSVKYGWIQSLTMYLSFYPSVEICINDLETYNNLHLSYFYLYEENKHRRAMSSLKILKRYIYAMQKTPRTLKYIILKLKPKTKSKLLLKQRDLYSEMVYI